MKHSLVWVLLVVLSGCSAFGSSKDKTEDWTVDQLYNSAKKELAEGNYSTAIEYYEKLEARFPFGVYAQQAQLDVIYAYYKDDQAESAIIAADRFIRLYPRHPNVDYAYYLKGLVNFERDRGFFDRFLPIDKAQRDQNATTESFQNFSELLTRYPDSSYVTDARQRMVYLRNNLAAHELYVAKYYIVRGAYLAAINRAKRVVENFQETPAVPDALVLMAKIYKAMGMQDLSNTALDVLKHNYPNHKGIQEVEALSVQG
ncbi:outer membrane protein assembly factor BamD [Beggiatoa leptomitoformis]|uniref:Outer membrane protein assembly factor BamD n=1 Tax=Beggiatoa leptomitoformis TaxID=288004 RepID=A0A2N9YI21_9GAMM|nr:outer membrane protein assembly factor BamD [Beggiatoa leptomitoformis]ALG67628.2 outer membrane protein assembly factor BamD [Beggiatoa leptomitoformis]AUI70140.2 outer membrane protein assembly factor BamD [Beggiatoa leptomitoformis]